MTGSHREFIFASYGPRETTKGHSVKKRTLSLCTLAAACGALGAAGAFAADARSAGSRGTPAMPPPSSFSARVDNQWFPLLPGTRYVYTGVKDGKPSRDVMTVTHETR